jgi:hypothetical protein
VTVQGVADIVVTIAVERIDGHVAHAEQGVQ